MFRKAFLLVYFFSLSFVALFAQNRSDLSLHQDFFDEQKEEFTAWVKTIGFDAIAIPKRAVAEQHKVTFYFQSVFATDDSLRVAWETAQNLYYQQYRGRVGERIFDQLAFLYDVALDELEIKILGNEFKTTNIAIFHQDNHLQVEENFPNVFANSKIILQKDLFKKELALPLGKLNVNALVAKESKKNITTDNICIYLGNYLQDYYRKKGTSWYRAHVDTTRTYYNKIIYRVTCLNNEIIQDGFFEYLQIKVEVAQQGDEVSVTFDLIGKYAPGLICPEQKSKFYKSMETYYPNELEEYAKHLQDKIEDYIRKYR